MAEAAPDFSTEEEAVDWKAQEEDLDLDRIIEQPDDTPIKTAARQYLKSRLHRDLREEGLATRLAELCGFEFSSEEDRDHWLLAYARDLVGKYSNPSAEE